MKSTCRRLTGGLVAACIVAAAAGLAPPREAAADVAPETGISPVFQLDDAVREAGALPRLYSLLVSWKGERVLEHYYNGHDAGRIANVKSVSKSVLSALVGIAIERGDIVAVEQAIGEYFDLNGSDVVKASITVAQLLTMQAGLETTSNRNYGSWVMSANWVDNALARPLRTPPGTVMEYSTGNTHLLSAVLTKATGKSTLEFARETLAEPLGFRLAPWPRDPQGIYFGGNDMEMTPRQMLAFGELYLNGGRADGRQIVPEAWVEASLRPHARSPRGPDRYYGYGWWLRQIAGFDSAYAWGYGGQFIILVPDLDLVVVTTSSPDPADDRRLRRQRLTDLVENLIVVPVAEAL